MSFEIQFNPEIKFDMTNALKNALKESYDDPDLYTITSAVKSFYPTEFKIAEFTPGDNLEGKYNVYGIDLSKLIHINNYDKTTDYNFDYDERITDRFDSRNINGVFWIRDKATNKVVLRPSTKDLDNLYLKKNKPFNPVYNPCAFKYQFSHLKKLFDRSNTGIFTVNMTQSDISNTDGYYYNGSFQLKSNEKITNISIPVGSTNKRITIKDNNTVKIQFQNKLTLSSPKSTVELKKDNIFYGTGSARDVIYHSYIDIGTGTTNINGLLSSQYAFNKEQVDTDLNITYKTDISKYKVYSIKISQELGILMTIIYTKQDSTNPYKIVFEEFDTNEKNKFFVAEVQSPGGTTSAGEYTGTYAWFNCFSSSVYITNIQYNKLESLGDTAIASLIPNGYSVVSAMSSRNIHEYINLKIKNNTTNEIKDLFTTAEKFQQIESIIISSYMNNNEYENFYNKIINYGSTLQFVVEFSGTTGTHIICSGYTDSATSKKYKIDFNIDDNNNLADISFMQVSKIDITDSDDLEDKVSARLSLNFVIPSLLKTEALNVSEVPHELLMPNSVLTTENGKTICTTTFKFRIKQTLTSSYEIYKCAFDISHSDTIESDTSAVEISTKYIDGYIEVTINNIIINNYEGTFNSYSIRINNFKLYGINTPGIGSISAEPVTNDSFICLFSNRYLYDDSNITYTSKYLDNMIIDRTDYYMYPVPYFGSGGVIENTLMITYDETNNSHKLVLPIPCKGNISTNNFGAKNENGFMRILF